MIIYLIQLQFCWRCAKIDIFARETGAGRPIPQRRDRDATVPEDQLRKVSGCADRLSSLCFVLHRMGFFLPRELLRER